LAENILTDERGSARMIQTIRVQSAFIRGSLALVRGSESDRRAENPGARLLVERRVLDAGPAGREVRQDQDVIAVEHIVHVELHAEIVFLPDAAMVAEDAVEARLRRPIEQLAWR